jgi:hypothetical protein
MKVHYIAFCTLITILPAMAPSSEATLWAQDSPQPSAAARYISIDKKAQALKANDDASIRALADEIFAFPHVFGRLPAAVEAPFKDRLVGAEAAHLAGRAKGVREEDIVRFVDRLADKLGVPDYARTNLHQVQVVRMRLALQSPAFMGRNLARADAKVGERVNSEMSPLQAVHLLSVLFDQKLINPDFQVSAKEWPEAFRRQSADRARHRQEAAEGKKVVHTSAFSADKQRELKERVINATSNFGMGDVFDLVDDACTTLKINR